MKKQKFGPRSVLHWMHPQSNKTIWPNQAISFKVCLSISKTPYISSVIFIWVNRSSVGLSEIQSLSKIIINVTQAFVEPKTSLPSNETSSHYNFRGHPQTVQNNKVEFVNFVFIWKLRLEILTNFEYSICS